MKAGRHTIAHADLAGGYTILLAAAHGKRLEARLVISVDAWATQFRVWQGQTIHYEGGGLATAIRTYNAIEVSA